MNQPKLMIQHIAQKAMQIPSAEKRSLFLDRVCRDKSIRHKVEFLLKESETMAGADHLTEIETEDQSEDYSAGLVVGPYLLTEEIGRGGFGVVFSAKQTEPIVRDVALKLTKPGMDTKEVLKRFENERQTLAILNHPGIARILDAGKTENHRPYFVMELVHGLPITEYCNKQKLSICQRLKLFCNVCRAVGFAHQNGVIHRDLKPSNILVETRNRTAEPKIIDFGIAKVIDQGLSVDSVHTNTEVIVGSPPYMSPEQTAQKVRYIDARSDIYSLGIILFELITGDTPFDQKALKESGIDEMLRVIREVDIPAPSKWIRANGTNELRKRVKFDADLDCIVLKAASKDREFRYETVQELEKDIQRYLQGMPIDARPPSVSYRTKRFIGRNKIAFFSILTVAMTLIVSSIFSIYMVINAIEKEAAAERIAKEEKYHRQIAEQKTEEVLEALERASARRKTQDEALDFIKDLMVTKIPDTGKPAQTLQDALKQKRIDIEKDSSKSDEKKALLYEMYAMVLDGEGEKPFALEHYHHANLLHKEIYDPQDRIAINHQRKYAKALISLRMPDQAWSIVQKHWNFYKKRSDQDIQKLSTMNLLTEYYIAKNNLPQAQLWSNVCYKNSNVKNLSSKSRNEIARNRATVLAMDGKVQSALALRKKIVAKSILENGSGSFPTLVVKKELVRTLILNGDHQKALRISTELVATSSSLFRNNEYEHLNTLSLHVKALQASGKIDQAAEQSMQLCQLGDQRYGEDFIPCLWWKNQYADVLIANRNHFKALQQLNVVMDSIQKSQTHCVELTSSSQSKLKGCFEVLNERPIGNLEIRSSMILADKFLRTADSISKNDLFGNNRNFSAPKQRRNTGGTTNGKSGKMKSMPLPGWPFPSNQNNKQ